MALPRSIYRHTMHWTLPGSEVAACSVHWRPDVGGANTLNAEAVRLESRAQTFWTAIKGLYNASTNYVGSTTYELDVNGLVVGSADIAASAVPGTGTSVPLPHEVAICLSLLTGNGTRRGKGRIYLPAPTIGAMTTNGRLISTFTSTVINAFAAYCGDMSSPVLNACVFSRVAMATNDVLNVGIGDVPDAQRRRRDALGEVRTLVNV